MLVITGCVMNLSVALFAVYGIYVLVKWRKAVDKVNKMCDEMCDEMREEMHPTKIGGAE